jgi:chaperonin GroES
MKIKNPTIPKPVGDRILVELFPAETEIHGLAIPDEYKKQGQEGIVLRLGTGRITSKGITVPFEVKPGDRVIMTRFDVPKIVLPEGEWMMPDSDHILAILEERNADNIEKLAANLYLAYCMAVGGKAFNGDPLPDWQTFHKDKTKTRQADAWRKVARAAILFQ